MNSISKNTKEKFIQRLLELFGNPNQNELIKDLEKAQKLEKKPNSLNHFIKKYFNSKIDSQICQQMIYDIISKLINIRKDFSLFMQIYMAIDDKLKAEALRHHFLLKNEEVNKIEDETPDDSIYAKFEVNLSCIYDVESYYQKFIKGILHYFQLAFKENYLYQYIESDYFKNPNESKFYKENTSSLEYSLNNMLIDINRVISEHSVQSLPINNNSEKISAENFETLTIKAHLFSNNEITSIYNNCENNDELIKKVNDLICNMEKSKQNELYQNLRILKDDLQKYIENDNIKKTVANNNAEIYFNLKEIKRLKKENNDLNKIKEEVKDLKQENNTLNIKVNNLSGKNKELESKVNSLNDANKELESKVNSLSDANKELESKVNSLSDANKDSENKVNSLSDTNKELEGKVNSLSDTNNNLEKVMKKLEEKVDFMEPIVLSLICRKAINYSFVKILEKYKKNLKVTLYNISDNDFNYKITFVDSVNNLTVDELNYLIDKLFVKKDEYNKDSHLVNKDLPTFMNDLWDKVKKNWKLNQNEIAAFDAIITDDIKSSFNFGAKDISVKDYLKNVDIHEFGKK